MRIITAIHNAEGRGYDAMAANMLRSVMDRGYKASAYALPEDPMTRYEGNHSYFVPCFFKPQIILRALNEFPGEDVLWLDSDCLMRARVDEMLDGCDVAVTLRRFDLSKGLRSLYDGYLNAGVMAFRNNGAVRDFIALWVAEFGKENDGQNSDQMGLNRLLIGYSPMQKYGEIINVEGALVKILDCDTYNFFYFDESPERVGQAKILHVKGSLREKHYKHALTMAGI